MARSNGTAVATREPAVGFLDMLERSREQIALVLPEHVKAERVVRVARTAYMMDGNLQHCTPKSILSAVMRACELGLEPGGALKHAYLVPYKDQCQLILGYAGVLELARRTGQFRKIETREVYEKDRFFLAYRPDAVFEHSPHLDGDPGPIVRVYAYARLDNGELAFEIMSRQQVEEIRRRLRNPNTPSWRDYWGEMARKVVLKRFLKRHPLSVEMADAIDHDNALEATFEAVAHEAAPAGNFPTRSAALAHQLRNRRLPIPAPEPEPEFAADEGVERPVYDEADEAPVESREPGDDDPDQPGELPMR